MAVDQDLCKFPQKRPPLSKRTKKNTELTDIEIIEAARHTENLNRMMEIFNIRIGEDGKWVIEMATRAFAQPWFNLNGKALKGGGGIVKKFGLGSGQNGIRAFAENIFGQDNMRFIESKRGGGRTAERIGEERIINELQKAENQAVFRQWGITLEGDTCHVNTRFQDFRPNAKFKIEKRMVRGRTILEQLGLPVTQRGLIALCKRVYPDHEVKCEKFTNGFPIHRRIAGSGVIGDFATG